MRVVVEWQDKFFRWHRYQEMNHQASAYRTAEQRAASTGKRHRLVDTDGHLLDLVDP